MKRYLVFAGDDCYPRGGMDDLKGSFDTYKEAMDFILNHINEWDWHHIYDVVESERSGNGSFISECN